MDAAIHRRAGAFAVTVLERPHDGQWGRHAVYEDPDGNIISLTAAGVPA